MKKALFLCIAALLSTSSFATLRTLSVVNHFNEALEFKIDRNRSIVPDFAEKFTLAKNQPAKTRIFPGSKDANIAYIGVIANKSPKKTAFFGVSTEQVSGYLSIGIAYSWEDQEYTTMTFCTPEEYTQKGHC